MPREPWHQVARRLRSAVEAERAIDVNYELGDALPPPPAIVAAMEQTGYSINVLRRFLAVLEWAEQVSRWDDFPMEGLERAPFSSLEVVRRIWAVDLEKGRECLRAVLAGRITSIRLREFLRELAIGSAAAGPMDRRMSIAAYKERRLRCAKEILCNGLVELSESYECRFLDRDPPIPYVRANAMAALFQSPHYPEWVDGFDIRELSSKPSPDEIDDVLCRAEVSATWFRRYFILVIEPSQECKFDLSQAIRSRHICGVGLTAINLESHNGIAQLVPWSPFELDMERRRHYHGGTLPPTRRQLSLRQAFFFESVGALPARRR